VKKAAISLNSVICFINSFHENSACSNFSSSIKISNWRREIILCTNDSDSQESQILEQNWFIFLSSLSQYTFFMTVSALVIDYKKTKSMMPIQNKGVTDDLPPLCKFTSSCFCFFELLRNLSQLCTQLFNVFVRKIFLLKTEVYCFLFLLQFCNLLF